MSKPKKKFSESTVGKLLFGAASIVNPTLGNVLKGVTSPKDAIAEIGKAKIDNDDKIKLQQLIYEQQNKEIEKKEPQLSEEQQRNKEEFDKAKQAIIDAGIPDAIDIAEKVGTAIGTFFGGIARLISKITGKK